MILARLAPNAERVAISRCRSRMRASMRLAMFPQAISKTNPTAPSTTTSRVRVSPIRIVSSVWTFAHSCCVFVFGYSFARWDAIVLKSWSAWATVTPGFSLPIALRKWVLRLAMRGFGLAGSSSTAKVVQKLFCGWLTGKRKDAGMTPITVYGSPFRLILRPTADLSDPN